MKTATRIIRGNAKHHSLPAIKRCVGILSLLTLLGACGTKAPTCPYVAESEPVPSAGCFAVSTDGLLVVQSLNGKVSVPGGSSLAHESPRCTAFRETWEETGLRLRPAELLQVFDTGFHLYRCEQRADSGGIDPPFRLEIRAAFYLPANRFGDYEWRYGYQQVSMSQLLVELLDAPTVAE